MTHELENLAELSGKLAEMSLLPEEAVSLLFELGQLFASSEKYHHPVAQAADEAGAAHPLEAKLRRAEARYRVLVEQIPAVTFLAGLGDEHNELYVSPQIEILLGFSQREWLENPILWYTQLHPEDRERWHLEFASTCATGVPFCSEYRFIARDGRVVWIRGEAKFVRDDQGRLVYLQGVAFDITAIKRAELELRAINQTLSQRVQERTAELQQVAEQLTLSNSRLHDGETRLRAILDTAVEGIITISAEGLIEGFNRAAERTFGYAAEEVLGKNVSLLMPAPYTQEHDQYLKAYLRTGIKKIIGIGREVTGRRKDGSTFPLELAVSEVPLEDRQLFTGVVRDITERKRVEAALRQAKEEAEAANLAKSDFLSRTSHELRTPLNAILGFAQMLELGSPNPRQQRQIDQIIKGGRHLLALINEVLDIARIEAGGMGLSMEPLRIGTLIQEVLDLSQPLADKGSIEVRVDLAGYADRFLLADNQRLKQVLLNLFSNGVKYNCPRGKVTVGCLEKPPGRLRIYVSDTGPGIPEDKMGRLFTPFERLGVEKTGIEGSGLGLVLSKRLTEAMGGTMGVTSVPGQGSTFYVEFAEAQRQQQPLLADDPAAKVSAQAAARTATVLFVEDNLANVSLVEEVLGFRPHLRLLSAMQGGLGLELALLHRPDVILLDAHLPDMKGDAFLEKIKRDGRLCEIPVIVLSADATMNQIARMQAAGAREYLTKPLDIPQFLATLDKVLKEGKR